MHDIPAEYWKVCFFAVTSPHQLNEDDITYLPANYGYTDDYGKQLAKDQYIFRAHYSSLYTWLDEFQQRFIMHVPQHIILAQYRYFLPPWMINMCFFEQFFYQCIDKKASKNMQRHRLNNLVFLDRFFSSPEVDYGIWSMF